MDQNHGPAQLTAKFEHPVYLDCSCCGKLIENSTDQNASFGLEPYPHDQGFGMCFDCGGDPQSDDIRTQLGWAGRTFFETRMSIVREHLNPENRAKFDAMNYERKVAFIGRVFHETIGLGAERVS